MSSGAVADGEAFTAAFDALDAAIDTVLGLDGEMLRSRERLALLRRYERAQRRLSAGQHPLINGLAREATAEELGGTLSHALAEATLTSRAEAGRRVREAADLGARCGLTGEPLAPVLAATAAAQRDGKLGREHVAVIRRFYRRLPGFIDADTRDHAEAHLAALGTQYRPDQLARLAERLADCLNPDGGFTDEDRAQRRGLTLGPAAGRWHVGAQRLVDAGSPRHPGGGAGQAGRAGHVQPERPAARRRWCTRSGRDRWR